MKANKQILTSLAAILAITQASFAIGKNRNENHDENPIHKLAITACATQDEGAQVKFEHPIWGQVNAICFKSPHDGKLVAMAPKIVEHIKQSQEVCAGKLEGAKVSINTIHNSDKKVDATCQKKGEVLSARPTQKMRENRHHKKPFTNQ